MENKINNSELDREKFYKKKLYEKKCECGKILKVWGDDSSSPEYTLIFFIECCCGKLLEFELPVN